MRFDVHVPFACNWENGFCQINALSYRRRSKNFEMCMIRRFDLQRHCGAGERFMKRIGYVNFKRHLDARLELGRWFEADIEIAFAFYRLAQQTERA